MEKANTTKDKYIKLSDLLFAVWDKIIILIIIGAVIAAGVFAMEYLKAKRLWMRYHPILVKWSYTWDLRQTFPAELLILNYSSVTR